MQLADDLELILGAGITGLPDPSADSDAASKAYVDTAISSVPGGLDTEGVQDIVGAMVTGGANITATYDDAAGTETIAVSGLTSSNISDFATAAVAAANAGTIDADTLGGQSASALQTAITSAIVASAPGTLDTLNEIAAALGDDPNFATTITTALAARVQTYATTIGDGSATSYTVTHSLGSKDVTVQLYATASPYGQVWATVEHTSTSTVTVIFASAPAAGAYRVVVQGRAD